MNAPNIPVDALPPLYTAVGELVINWAILESSIVKIIATIYHGAGGKHVDAKIPVAFKRQVKFLRLCSKRVGSLAPYASEIQGLLAAAAKLVIIRTAVVHGALSAYDPARLRYSFTKLDVVDGDTIHEVNTITTTLNDLRGAVIESQSLTRRAFALLDGLNKAFMP